MIGFVAVAVLILYAPGLVAKSGLAGSDPVWSETAFASAIYGALLVAALAGGRWTGVRVLYGGARPGVQFGRGVAIGGAAILLATTYCAIAGSLTHSGGTGAFGTLALGLAMVGLQVVAEEAYFRGWLQPLAESALGRRIAVPLIAAGFALLHVAGGLRGPIELVNLLLGGVLFGLLAARGGGIAAAVGAHLAWNGIEQLALGLDPNPGVGAFGSLADFDLAGPARWGGSDAGLNASVAMGFALAAVLVPLMLTMRSVDRAAPGVDAVA